MKNIYYFKLIANDKSEFKLPQNKVILIVNVAIDNYL